MKPYALCGECCAVLLQRGGVERKPSGLALGIACMRHPSLAATHVVEAEEGAALPRLEDDDTAGSPSAPVARPSPSSVGPVTDLAARFIVAWSTDTEEKVIDRFMVTRAVSAARMLIEETGGR